MPNYLMNWWGITLNDDKMKDIMFPRMEVYTHVTFKCTETATIMGAGVIGPIQCLQEGKYDSKSLQARAFQCGKQGLVVGLFLGPILAHLRLHNQKFVTIYDRAYRLRYNFNQCRADRFSVVGSAAGAGLAYYLGENAQQGAIFGFAGGCLLAGMYNYVTGTMEVLQGAI